jgi:hypothetical protein
MAILMDGERWGTINVRWHRLSVSFWFQQQGLPGAIEEPRQNWKGRERKRLIEVRSPIRGSVRGLVARAPMEKLLDTACGLIERGLLKHPDKIKDLKLAHALIAEHAPGLKLNDRGSLAQAIAIALQEAREWVI